MSRSPHRWNRMLACMAMFSVVFAGLIAGVQPALALGGGSGSVNLTTLGSAYTQDFNTLANTGTTNNLTINGWYLNETGSSGSNNGQYAAGTGSGTAGDTYSFGAATSTERAFGGLLSGTLNPTIGAQFTNNTGSTVTSLDISYIGEMWRAGVTNRNAADRLDFQLSTNATSLTTGTWVDYNSLDFNSPNINATAGALNGNASGNQTPVSFSITGLSIPNGASFWIRWNEFDISPGADDGLAVDTFSLTPRIVDFAPEVDGTFPVNGATDFPINANLTVSFSEPVNVSASWFTLICSVSGPSGVPTTFSGGPTDFTLDPGISLTDGETCTLTILANQVSDQDGNDPPDNMVMNFVVGFSPFDVCAASYTPIYTIQGSGLSTPIPGTVTTKGVVVGDFEGSAGQQGFYLQDLSGDGDPATSDGIFVFTGSSDIVSVGQVVRVTGFARERFDQTTINGSNSNGSAVPAANIVNCGTGSVAATDVSMPFTTVDEPERFEGMLVKFPQALVISEYFNYERFGEIVIALPLDGESRPFTGTSIDEPGPPALDRAYQNSLRRITLDDGLGTQNPATLRHPNGDTFDLTNRFRGGDTVANTVGVLGYDFGLYRIQPTEPADYTSVNPRPASPEPVGGTVRVAAMNTLNFFVTADYPTGDPLDNKCGPANSLECRGWDSDQSTEFTRQRDKLLTALSGLDADIIGLNELENSTGVEPLASIVSGLPGYAYINTGTIGTDAIKVGLIYRPAVVTPVGDFKLLTSAVDSRFIDTKSRPSLAQTFMVNATGAKFTVAINHLKSKGSACDDVSDPDLGDGQGNCSQTRRAAAEALVDWLATDPTGSGDPDFMIMGDLNSYAQEDTIDEIKAGSDDTVGTNDDFTNLISHFHGAFAYSYTFDGAAGYLDHALANASLLGQVTGAADWHINSDEPDIFDYDTTFKPPAQDALYEVNAYRTSDHDPVVVGLDPINYPPTADANGPYSVVEGGSVQLNATGVDPEGTTVTFEWDLDNDGTFETPGQSVNFSAASITAPATLTVKVKVTDAFGNFAVDDTTVSVLYNFAGFFQPVDNLPTFNSVKAGQAVPVKFSLSGDQGLSIFADGYPKMQLVTCGPGPVDIIEETVTSGASGLQYDPSTDAYTYVLKTQKSWKGSCGQLVVMLNDGTTHTANFQFT
jgi:predicted extracellular nuclease